MEDQVAGRHNAELLLPKHVNSFVRRAEADIQPVGYTRFSTRLQTKNSTDRQTDKIYEYAEARRWPRPIIFSDEAVPGTTTSRVKFDAMFEYCSDRPGTPIIVESMSRISRDGGAYHEFFVRRRATRAITHVCGLGELDELQEGIFQTIAAYEYRNLLGIMRDGRCQAAAEGKVTRQLQYGVIADAGGYIDFDPVIGPIIVKMFKLAAGGMRFVDIARYLTIAEIPGPGPQGEWTGDFIGNIIRSPVYAGRMIYNPGVFAWEQPPKSKISLQDLAKFENAEIEAS